MPIRSSTSGAMSTSVEPRPETLAPFVAGRPAGGSGLMLPLQSPTDLQEFARLLETPEALIDEAVADSHAAYLAHRRATAADRARWLSAAAKALEDASAELVRMLISDIGKPHKAATFEVQRSPAFLRA